MAVFKILKLNKMTCGNRRGLIDMTVQISGIMPEVYLLPGTNLSGLPEYPNKLKDAGIATESNTDYEYVRDNALYDYYPVDEKSAIKQESTVNDLILNEQQLSIDGQTYNNRLSAYNSLSGSDAIQLTPDFWYEMAKNYSQIDNFNSELANIRIVYEFEIDQVLNNKAVLKADGSSTKILPLNDLLDLCVKSAFKKSAINYSIPGNLILEENQMTYSRNVDQYFVFDGNPVGFCQFHGDAFLISPSMTTQPYRMQSDLKNQIKSGSISDPHTFQLVRDELSTVLYPSTSSWGVRTYAAHIAQSKLNTEQSHVIDMFTPAKYITGINYNYIVCLEQNKNFNRQFDNPTIYDNGDIFGSFIVGKNMYNSLYSMEMSNAYRMLNCREYIDVQAMGNKLMLKFYDNSDYEIDKNSNATVLSTSSSVTKSYPYQKVETYEPINFSQNIKHKSNLFSIKIYNTGLDEQSLQNCSSEQAKIAESLKKSIANAMKHLADSIAPANTQLFDTYFLTDE